MPTKRHNLARRALRWFFVGTPAHALDLKELSRSLAGLSPDEQAAIKKFMAGTKSDQTPDDPTKGLPELGEITGGGPGGGPGPNIGGGHSMAVVPNTNARVFTGSQHEPWGEAIAKAVFRGSGQKDLLAANAALPVYMPAVAPIELGIPLTTFRQLLPSGDAVGGQYRYLAQTVRTNNAAIVVPGATKPTSLFTLEWHDGQTSVIAHVSEPLDRFMFTDAAQLGSFVDNEMYIGVVQALEEALLTSGPDPANGKNWVGFLHATSGIQTQPYDTDPLVSIRRGLQLVDNVGEQVRADGIVMHPDAWADLELMRAVPDGRFILSSGPADISARRLWSRPVALTNAIDPDIALVGAFGSSCALLGADNGEIAVEWSGVAMDVWVRNQVIWRGEGRWALALTRPVGFAQAALAP